MTTSTNSSTILDALSILKLTGTPFVDNESINFDEVDKALLKYAASNRMKLHFLEALNQNNINNFNTEFKELSQKYEKVNRTIVKIAEALEKNNIDYTFFKTLRPYKEVTVDIDTLILSNKEKATRILKNTGLRLLEVGPLSTTLWDEESEINIDIYEEVGVSHITYLDKRKLEPFIAEKEIIPGKYVKTIDAIADLLAIIAHSVIKEQMYVLSEYYTTIHYLHEMNDHDIDRLVETAKQWSLINPLLTHLTLSSKIHKAAHGFIPRPLKKILRKVGYNTRESERIEKRGYNTPYKYHPLTVGNSFIEKLTEPIAKRSLIIQLLKMFNPKFSMNFIKDAFRHIIRERY